MPAPSPTVPESDLTTISLKSNDKEMTDLYQVYSIYVSKAVNQIPLARIILLDGSTPDETFAASNSDDFAPGFLIEIEAGYHSNNSPLFSGVIVKHGLKHRHGGQSQLILECRSLAIKMTVARKNADHGQSDSTLTDSELMESLIKAHGLKPEVAVTSPQMPWMTQFNSSDWDFLIIRAQINGLLVLAEGDKVAVKAPNFSQEPTLSVTYGQDILELQTEIDASTQWSEVNCTAWDPSQQAMASATASPAGVNGLGSDTSSGLADVLQVGTVNLVSTSPLPADQLQSWAKAAILAREMAKISGKIRFQGSSNIAPGGLLQIGGLGKRFNGKGFVGAVNHRTENGNWTTEATLGVDPAWFASKPDVSGPPAGAQAPPVQGLQIGVVKKINADPAGERRVQVAVPVIAGTTALVWARLGSFHATKDGGGFFYPEIDDEVVLGFLDNDPRVPVILGSLYSSSRKGPHAPGDENASYTPDAENSQKAIVTHGQLRLLFDDKNKIITQTPNGNKLVLSDQDNSILLADENGNTIKLSKNGIELKSKTNISITADQSITEKGTQGVTVSGSAISLAADTEFSAKGNSTASLQSSGETTIKGTMVMIN